MGIAEIAEEMELNLAPKDNRRLEKLARDICHDKIYCQKIGVRDYAGMPAEDLKRVYRHVLENYTGVIPP